MSKSRRFLLNSLFAFGLAASIGFLLYAHSLSEWTDPDWFDKAINTQNSIDSLRLEDSARFIELRSRYVTSAFQLRDVGATLAIGFGLLLCARLGLSRYRELLMGTWIHVTLAILIPVSFLLGAVIYLKTEFSRFAYPPWADTLSIPMVGAIMVSAALFCVLAIHVAVLIVSRKIAAVGRIRSLFCWWAWTMALLTTIGLVFLMSTLSWSLLPVAALLIVFFAGLADVALNQPAP